MFLKSFIRYFCNFPKILHLHAAEKAAEKYQVPFLYRDFRPGFQDGQSKARELELYMQKYCGCIFSEEERYRRKQLEKERLQKECLQKELP